MGAIGGVTTKPANPRFLDLADPQWGLRSGPDMSAVLQAAHDYVRDHGGGAVHLPPGDYGIEKDVWWDSDWVELVGSGRVLTSLSTGPLASVIFGFPRTPGGRVLGNGHRVDLFGKLDASAAPAAGRRWGLRTHDPVTGSWGFPTFNTSPFQFGRWATGSEAYRPDYWATISTLNIDLALDAPTGTLAAGQIMGVIEGNATLLPGPLYCWYDGADFWLRFATVESDGSVVIRRIYVRGPSIVIGVNRISVEVDLAGATVRAWWNRTQRAVDLSQIGDGWAPVAGRRFLAPKVGQFNLGAISAYSVEWGNSDTISCVAQLDRTFCGLRYTAAAVYANDGVGQPQRRSDNATLNDLSQFFGDDSATFGYLALIDPPGPGRCVTVYPGFAGGPMSRGIFISNGDDTLDPGDQRFLGHGHILNDASQGQALRDLTIRCGSYQWTPPIIIGTLWNFGGIERIRIARGGVFGIGTLISGNSFPVPLRDCELHGTDAAVFLYACIGSLRDCNVSGAGRSMMRFISCGVQIEGNVTGFTPSSCFEYGYEFIDGVLSSVADVNFDAEGAAARPKGFIYAQSHGVVADDRLVVRDCTIGFGLFSNGSEAPVIVLDIGVVGDTGSSGHGRFAMEGLLVQVGAGDVSGPMVRVMSPGRVWAGTVRAGRARVKGSFGSPGGVEWVRYDYDSAIGSIEVELDEQDIPPNKNTWARNSFVLRAPDPRPGQYAQWIGPYKSGTYGTLYPPEWTGVNPVGTGRELAGYCLGQSYAIYAPPPPAWFPTDLPNLGLWLAADALTGLADGAPVATWPDASGLGHNATQATAGKRPTFRAAVLNGLPVVRFDVTDDALIGSAVFDVQYSIYVVFNCHDSSVSRRALCGSNNWLIGQAAGLISIYEGGGHSGPAAVADQFYLVEMHLDSLSLQWLVNGVDRSDYTVGGVPGTLHLGAEGPFPEPLYGDIAEVVAYAPALSGANRNKPRDYLKNKYLIY